MKSDHIAAGKPLSFRVTLKNAGEMDADEVVQVYLSDLQASAPLPLHKLVAFRRVHVQAGQSQDRPVQPAARGACSSWTRTVNKNSNPVQFRLTVGSCSPGKRGQALGAAQPVTAVFEVE